ncbi:MAG: HAMP domain-containing histidine kinase, partial [Rhodospirillaceae bacterium]|nr:HAMP domain-containing histidine kinase [Rhodospirillaceae bacterium]
MTRRSLRLRLLLAAAISISMALIVAGFGLVALFDRHVERRVDAELGTFLEQIATLLEFDDAGVPRLAGSLADVRFNRPYGGIYWQIEQEGTEPVRSRSLWDTVLELPPATGEPGAAQIHTLVGPDRSELRAYERRLRFDRAGATRELRIVVAIDRQELRTAQADFIADIVPALAVLALVLTAAFWAQVNVGLKPLEAVRQGVKAVKGGLRRRLGDDVPDEILPLVAEVNELLGVQEQAVTQARARAGDLAHGLKTPLTVLANDAHKLRARGDLEIAAEIEQLVARMRRHVDHELARVRMAAHGGHAYRPAGSSADLAPILGGIAEALKRSPKGETLTWHLSLAPLPPVAVEAQDLTELLGNLIDNGVKWARADLEIVAFADGGDAVIRIADDGPGVPAEALATLGRRGLRLDEEVGGTGIGLAIAR